MFYSENFSYSMDDRSFDKILEDITRETGTVHKKLDILYFSLGKFSAEQAEKTLFAIPSNFAKLQALRIMEPRLIYMNCQEARRILRTFIVYDRVEALHLIKRYLCDCQTRLGEEYILSMFPFDEQKQAALALLSTVRSDLPDRVPAGGFRKEGLCAGFPSLAPPLDRHTYGPIELQTSQLSNHSRMMPPRHYLTSLYHSHPTYSFAQPDCYAERQRRVKDGNRCNTRYVNAYSSNGSDRF